MVIVKPHPSPRASLPDEPLSKTMSTDELLAQAAMLRNKVIDAAAELAAFTHTLREQLEKQPEIEQ